MSGHERAEKTALAMLKKLKARREAELRDAYERGYRAAIEEVKSIVRTSSDFTMAATRIRALATKPGGAT